MAETYSLLEFLQQLSLDDGLRAAFTTDPQAALVEHGLAGLTAEDVHDAAVLVADTRTAEFSLDHAPAPDPLAGFLDAFLPAEPAYLPSDLGESVDLGDLPTEIHDDVPEYGGGFGTGHSEGAHLAAGDDPTEHVPALDESYAEHYGEHVAELDEHGDPDLDDLFVEHPAPGVEHHPEPPAH